MTNKVPQIEQGCGLWLYKPINISEVGGWLEKLCHARNPIIKEIMNSHTYCRADAFIIFIETPA